MTFHSGRGTARTLDHLHADATSRVILLGTSFKTADIGFRERFAEKLEDGKGFASTAGLSEFSVLQTCSRVELYCSFNEKGGDADSIKSSLGFDSSKGYYVKRDLDAIRHLFQVAAGLDSVAVGEGQILKQVRFAGLQSRASGNAKSVLTPLFDSAYTSGVRIRKRFHLALGAPSLSEIALDFALRRLGKTPSNVLMIGTGETARLAVRRLGSAKIHLLTNRSGISRLFPNSVRVSEKSLGRAIAKCELIVSATRRPGYVFSRSNIPDRGGKVILDLGFPRNVDPTVRSLRSVELIDLDDVASLAVKPNDTAKLAAAQMALEAEASRFNMWLTATRLNPALASMFRWAEGVRESETGIALRRLPELSTRERSVVEALSKRLVSKLMAPHAEFAKGVESAPDQVERLRLLEKIFSVDGSN